jgi:hypothetical protein
MLRPSSLQASSRRIRFCHCQLQARNVSTSRVSSTQSSAAQTLTSRAETGHLSKTLPGDYGSTFTFQVKNALGSLFQTARPPPPPSHNPSGEQNLTFSERMAERQASFKNPSSQLLHEDASSSVQQTAKIAVPPLVEIVRRSTNAEAPLQKTTQRPHWSPNQARSRAPSGTKENLTVQSDRENQERFARKVQNLRDKVAAQRLADRGTTPRQSPQPFVIRPNGSEPSRRSFREFLPSHHSSHGSPEIWIPSNGTMRSKRRKRRSIDDPAEEFERGYFSRIVTKEDDEEEEYEEMEGQNEDIVSADETIDPEVVEQGMLYQLVHNLDFSDLNTLLNGKRLESKLVHGPIKNSPLDQLSRTSKETKTVSGDIDASEQLSLSFETFLAELGDELDDQPSVDESESSTSTTPLINSPPHAEAHDATTTASSSSTPLSTLSPKAYQTLLKEMGGSYSSYTFEAGRDLEKADPLNHAGFALSRQRDIKLWRRRFAQGIVSKASQK